MIVCFAVCMHEGMSECMHEVYVYACVYSVTECMLHSVHIMDTHVCIHSCMQVDKSCAR